MAIVSRTQLKAWFRRGLKPLEVQFHSWIDSYWHKNDSIPMSSVDGLNDALNQRTISIDSALSDTSTNPVQNKVVSIALGDKQDNTDDSLPTTDKTIAGAIKELWNKFADYALSNHNHDNDYAAKNHSHSEYLTQHQDISGKQDVITDLATIRNNATMAAVRAYTLDFGTGAELIQDVNMLGAITINELQAFNVAHLYVTYGTVSHQEIDLTQPVSLNVANHTIIIWEIVRTTDDGLACVGVRCSINQSNA